MTTQQRKLPPSRKPNAGELLRDAALTFVARNGTYGNNHHHFGDIMAGLFPAGVTVIAAEDWNRMGVLVQCVSKLSRYAAQFNKSGHKDSARDLAVYAAMLEELTTTDVERERKSP